MNRVRFVEILEKTSNKLEYRDLLVNACLQNPQWVTILLNNMEQIEGDYSNFSARILELTCKENLEIIIPHLNRFCELLSKAKLNGVVRACAKLCELLMIEYFTKNNYHFKNTITNEHLKKMIEAGFDWMITDQKIAVQAYTMQTLYLLGAKFDWIHFELALIIEKNIPTGSTGYKNRGRKVLKAIKTNTRLKL